MPPQSPQNSSNYDFFLNPPEQPKNSLITKLKSSRHNLVIKLSVGSLLLLVVIVLISVVFSSNSTTGLLSLAQQQNELIRVSTEGLADAAQQTTKNVAVNIELSLTTSQQQLLVFMRSHGQSASTAQLDSTKNVSTDQQLQAAIATSNVDSVYLQITQSALSTYQQGIKQVFSSSTNTSERQLLNTEYQAASLLLSQTNSASQAIQNS